MSFASPEKRKKFAEAKLGQQHAGLPAFDL
jgi:hypothetical protein